MKKRLFLSAIVLLCAFTLAAESFTIVRLNSKQVSTKATDFIMKELKNSSLPFSATAIKGFDKLTGDEKVVVILNTGLKSGINPEIQQFIEASTDKSPFIIVNIYSVGNEVFVKITPASESPFGVDEISAASKWKNPGLFGGSNPNYDMHKEWTKELFAIIAEKLQ